MSAPTAANPSRTRANVSPPTGKPAPDPDRSCADAWLDLLVYAPIGLVLDAETVTPELARRGRQNSAAARQIGELAVRAGMRRLDEVVASVAEATLRTVPRPQTDEPSASQPTEPVSTQTAQAPETAPESTSAPGPGADDLAIPGYDVLAASQVVKRLDGLTAEELEAVRRYETANRDRRTILHKISRLQEA